MITPINENTYKFFGLSSDNKLITKGYISGAAEGETYDEVPYKISNGSRLFLIDTSEIYVFKAEEIESNGETKIKGTWVKISNATVTFTF